MKLILTKYLKKQTIQKYYTEILYILYIQIHTTRCPFQVVTGNNAKVKALQNIGMTAKPPEPWLVGTCGVCVFYQLF